MRSIRVAVLYFKYNMHIIQLIISLLVSDKIYTLGGITELKHFVLFRMKCFLFIFFCFWIKKYVFGQIIFRMYKKFFKKNSYNFKLPK
jgi:hypothetical protein